MVARLGDPPATLPPDPPHARWDVQRPMLRVFHEHPVRDGLAPRTFGPIARFDPHVRDRHQRPREDPTGRGVRYLAADLPTALAEAYPGQRPFVSICPHARAVWLRPTAAIELLDLRGDGALALGGIGTLAWGDEPRRRTQRWGRRIYEQYEHLHGIWYRCAHQGGEAVALWERVAGLTPAPGGNRRLWAVWAHIHVALAGQGRAPRRIAPTDCKVCRRYGYVT